MFKYYPILIMKNKSKIILLSLFNKMLLFFTMKQNQNLVFFNIKIYIYHMDITYKIIYKLYIYILWASFDKNVKHNIHPCKYIYIFPMFLSYKITFI